MSHAAARKAIESKLAAWAAARPVPIFFAQSVANQPAGLYLRGYLLPGGTTTPYIGGDANEYTGLYQVSIICPGVTQANAYESIVSELNTLFPVFSELVSGAFNGEVHNPVVQGPRIDEVDRYNIPVTIEYWGIA